MVMKVPFVDTCKVFDHFINRMAEFRCTKLPMFLKFGFPLDFPKNEECNLKSTEESHSSAIQYREHVDMYLSDEIGHQAIAGPYDQPPYGDATHISPFMTRDKSDSEKRRVIIDLSWPVGASINHFTTKRELQSVIGSLMFVHKCVIPTRFFVNRILQGFQEAKGDRIETTQEMRKDFRWFCKFLPIFNGTAKFDHEIIDQVLTLDIDACLQRGWGVGVGWGGGVGGGSGKIWYTQQKFPSY